MLFCLIELDDERIKKDRICNLDACYKCIDATFAQEEVTLYKKKGSLRLYTRNIDKDDMSCIFMVLMPLKKESWFLYYAKQWRFLEVDEKTNKILADEDLFEEWELKRPLKP